jgi:hypothetical protein
MTNWTTAQDVADRWIGSGLPDDTNLLTALITDAETVILSEFPRIQERIDDESLAQNVVTFVTVRMVSRLLRNPEGLTYWQQNTGPFGQGRTFDSKDVWLTDDERALLAPSGLNRRKAFSINMAPLAAGHPDELDPFDPLWTVGH